MRTKLREQQLGELQGLMRGGVLKPAAVVHFARNKTTALHGRFEWDDKKAGHEYRLTQARKLIETFIEVIPQSNKPVQVFCSLKKDRTKKDGGYRTTVAVLSDADLREQLLAQSLDELEYWQDKYAQLKELAPIFSAARRVRAKRKPRKPR